jgi:hypothetical protein
MKTFRQWITDTKFPDGSFPDEFAVGVLEKCWEDGYKSAAEFYQKQIQAVYDILTDVAKPETEDLMDAIKILQRCVTPISAGIPKDPLDNP